MVDWKTIRIPEDDFKRHNKQRKELGLTWAEYINGEREGVANDTTPSDPVQLEASEYSKIAREVVEALR
jgi:hypothetical protein